MSIILLLFVLLLSILSLVYSNGGGSVSVTASVRGKKYTVDASTVEEFTEKVETLAGLEVGQNSVLFRGKVLNPEDKLEEIGVASGDVLMVVKGKKRLPKVDNVSTSLTGETSSSSSSSSTTTTTPSSKGLNGMGFPGMGNIGDIPGMENVSPEDLKKTMAAMDNLLDSNYLDEYFSNDEQLEKSRQQILSNLDQYESMMPGFKDQMKDIVTDPEKWKEAMTQARSQLTKLKSQRDEMRKKTDTNTTNQSTNESVDDVDEDE